MQATSTIFSALAAAALLTSAGTAQALESSGPEAWASMSNFQIQIIDLDLNDGIAAAVTFDDYTLAFGTNASAQTRGGPTTPDVDAGPLFTATSSSAQVGFSKSTSSTSAGDPFLPSIRPGATAYSTAVGQGSFSASFGTVVSTSGGPFSGAFTLTPHTRLVFSADTSGVGVAVSQPGEFDFADAYAQVLLASLSCCDSSTEKSYAHFKNGVFESNDLTHVTAQLDNLSENAFVGWAFAGVGTQTYVLDASLIPEPETYLLALLGVLVIGAEARRQDRR